MQSQVIKNRRSSGSAARNPIKKPNGKVGKAEKPRVVAAVKAACRKRLVTQRPDERRSNVAMASAARSLRSAVEQETRDAQISAAIYPSERDIFRAACERRGISVSDEIREHMIDIVEAEGLI